jgi:ABC-type transport system involved in cytochrome bd biosynthesis fused ATPase/permease subunit
MDLARAPLLLSLSNIQPSAGKKIELSGRMCSETRRAEPRQMVQQTALFNMSILENIRYSNPDASKTSTQRGRIAIHLFPNWKVAFTLWSA